MFIRDPFVMGVEGMDASGAKIAKKDPLITYDEMQLLKPAMVVYWSISLFMI